MSLPSLVRCAVRLRSEDARIREDLEYGVTTSLYRLRERTGPDELTFPDCWWAELWLRRRFNVGALGCAFFLFIVFAIVPKLLVTFYIYLPRPPDDDAINYLSLLWSGIIGDFSLIAIPSVSVAALFGKLRRFARAASLSFRSNMMRLNSFAACIVGLYLLKHSSWTGISTKATVQPAVASPVHTTRDCDELLIASRSWGRYSSHRLER